MKPPPPRRQYRRWWRTIGPIIYPLVHPIGRLWMWLTGPTTGRYLHPVIWGRRIHPVAFGISLYTGILAFAILTDSAIVQLLDGPIGEAIGLVCAAATAWLWAGWWARRRDWLQRGLSWATAGITAVATTIIIDAGWASVSAWLSAPVAVIAFGSWLLERADPQGRR